MGIPPKLHKISLKLAASRFSMAKGSMLGKRAQGKNHLFRYIYMGHMGVSINGGTPNMDGLKGQIRN